MDSALTRCLHCAVMGEMLMGNINDGYLEGLLRGYRQGILTSTDYANLCQCETIDGAAAPAPSRYAMSRKLSDGWLALWPRLSSRSALVLADMKLHLSSPHPHPHPHPRPHPHPHPHPRPSPRPRPHPQVAAVSSAASGAGLLTFLVPYDSFSAVATLLRLVDGPSFEPNARPRLQRWMALLPRGLYSSRLREGLAFLLSVVVPSASLVWSPRHCAEAHSRRQRHTSQPSPAPQP